MPDIKRKQGYATGKEVSGYQLYYLDIWNTWDDLALYKSLFRRPSEDNITLRSRILAAKNYNSTKQGLVNWLSDSFGADKYKVADKTIYFSTYSPLSYMQYNKLKDKNELYYPPRVIVDGVNTITFPVDKPLDLEGTTVEKWDNGTKLYMYNNEKTEVYKNGATWILWKNIDQAYFQVWETNVVPEKLILKYQYMIDGELFVIEESAKKLIRDEDGNIVEK